MSSTKLIAVVLLPMLLLLAYAPIAYGAPATTTRNLSQCVRIVPSGSTVDSYANRVLLPNGTIVGLDSIPCLPGNVASTTGNLAYGLMQLGTSYYYTNFQDQWSTPSAPSAGSSFTVNQYIDVWDGPENTYTGEVIQPILTFGCIAWSGSTCTEGGNFWSIFDEAILCNVLYCNSPIISTSFAASAGDAIVGTVIRDPNVSFCSSDGPAYTIASGDSTTGQTVNLIVCDTNTYSTAVAGSLEVHNLSTCNQMPGAPGSLTFSSISYTTSPSGGTVSYSTGSQTSLCNALAGWYTGYGKLGINWDYS